MQRVFLVIIVLFSFTLAFTQTITGASAQSETAQVDSIPISLTEKRFNEKYQKNIKKSRINGVYIPVDLEDAFNEIQALAQKQSLDKFKKADAEFVVNRLHYGLGRWIILNWNLYDGSRIGEHVKSYGVTHPDDQARFILLTLHNKLNGKDLGIKLIAQKLQQERQAELERRKG